MAWCQQAPSHYLNQCWPTSLMPYGITRPEWVKGSILWKHDVHSKQSIGRSPWWASVQTSGNPSVLGPWPMKWLEDRWTFFYWTMFKITKIRWRSGKSQKVFPMSAVLHHWNFCPGTLTWSHCNLFKDQADEIYGCPIFKRVADTWLHDRVPG